ncbi:MAG: LamG-like jellyroll fold domain-containing protein [Planctomycetota bacterium]
MPALRGVTLMELLAVLAIVSMMMALGVGTYVKMSTTFKEQGAASQLDVALRQARNAAVSANAPAFVELDVEHRRIVPWVYHTVGFWHFEDRNDLGKTTGAYHDAIMRGAESYPDGKVGKCVRLREGACVELGSDPDFDCEDGGYLEAYIRPATYVFTGDNFVFSKKNAYYLKVGLRGILEGNSGGKTVKSTGYSIVPGRWSKVAMAWDRHSTRLLVDDCLVGAGLGGKTPLSDYPLMVGHETASLDGLVDEVRVMSAAPGNVLEFPKNCSFKHTAAPWNAVYFAGDGSLDLRYHAGPLSITIIQGPRTRTVNISMLGQTSIAEVEHVESQDQGAATAAAPPPSNKLKLSGPDGSEAPPKAKAPDAKNTSAEKQGQAPPPAAKSGEIKAPSVKPDGKGEAK